MDTHLYAAGDAMPQRAVPAVRRRRRTYVVVVNGYGDGRDMYVEYLRFHGFTVDAASDPTEAIRLIELHTPDVIVTDFAFPIGHIDGPDFVARLRLMATGHHPIVIVISGFSQRADETRAREAGADRFLLKPCLPKALLGEIERMMRNRRRRIWH